MFSSVATDFGPSTIPEDNILLDNSNASVGCDCLNCGGCDVWFCNVGLMQSLMVIGCKKQRIGIVLTVQKHVISCISASDYKASKKLCFNCDDDLYSTKHRYCVSVLQIIWPRRNCVSIVMIRASDKRGD